MFGEVVQGFEIVRLIENLPTDEKSRPLTKVLVSHCGELVLKAKKKKRADSGSSPESKKKKKKEKKKSKKAEK